MCDLPSGNNENTFLYDRFEEFGWGTKFLLELDFCKGAFWGDFSGGEPGGFGCRGDGRRGTLFLDKDKNSGWFLLGGDQCLWACGKGT
jgi:hypothetical protein